MVAHYGPGTVWGPRVMADFELVWMITGGARWTVWPGHKEVNAVEHHLAQGWVWVAQPGSREHYQWDPQLHSSHAFVHFQLDDLAGLVEPSQWPLAVNAGDHPALRGLCDYLLRLPDAPPCSDVKQRPDRVADVLALLLRVFIDGPIPPAGAAHPDPAVIRVANEVAQIWLTEGVRIISVRELAAGIGMSQGHLSRLFSARMRTGIAEALELVRLGRAAIALQRTDFTLARIAADVGYGSPYHLSRRFHLHYGRPPSNFRREGWTADPLEPLRRRGLLPLWDAINRAAL